MSLIAHAMHHGLSWHDAEDAIQDAALRAWREGTTLDRRLVRLASIDLYRRENRRGRGRKVPIHSVPLGTLSEPPGQEGWINILRRVAALTPAQYMHDVEGLTWREMGAALGVNASAVWRKNDRRKIV